MNTKMWREGQNVLNFAVGPVQTGLNILEIGAEQVPYFRTKEFSELMIENEMLMKKFANAEEQARVVFLTGSGTASMEAAVINCFCKSDKVLVINGGSFGQRFVELCKIHNISFDELPVKAGYPLTSEMLAAYDGKGYTGFLVNLHETSTGVLYDAELIGDFCRRNEIFLVVDAISAFLADPFDMQKMGADVMITSSQKALACPPGVSVLVLSSKAIERINANETKCMYFDIKNALKNGERGQTPFTPAVGILRQLNARLRGIAAAGGVEKEIERVANQARDFRTKIKKLPFSQFSQAPSNAVTAVQPLHGTPSKIFMVLKDEYKIWICPNGGELGKRIFRVGHIGALTPKDNDQLVSAFKDLQKRGIL